MKVLDLFAGIGGFSLAAHWLGHETIGFVEWDKYNQKVLAKNFPGVPIHGDIKTYNGLIHSADIITGGFPCQPFSTAGKRQGANDDRYLWPEMLRIVREVQPTYVIGENVAGIYSMDDGRVFERVCTDMEDEGYAVQPFRIPACATGAPHRRDRWWFAAVKNADGAGNGRLPTQGGDGQHGDAQPAVQVRVIADANQSNDRRHNNCFGFQSETDQDESKEQREERDKAQRQWSGAGFSNGTKATRNTDQAGLQGRGGHDERTGERFAWPSDRQEYWPQVAARLCRVDARLPAWVDRHRTNRLKSLGNSIQPQVAYEILKAMLI